VCPDKDAQLGGGIHTQTHTHTYSLSPSLSLSVSLSLCPPSPPTSTHAHLYAQLRSGPNEDGQFGCGGRGHGLLRAHAQALCVSVCVRERRRKKEEEGGGGGRIAFCARMHKLYVSVQVCVC